MAETFDPRFLDKRTAERYIRLGLLDEKVWEKYLRSLPDAEEKSSEVETSIGQPDALDKASEGDESEPA